MTRERRGGNRRYRDRRDAGRVLGQLLADTRSGAEDPLVLGLPRGGVPVADEIAHAIDGTLDVLVVRKLGFPGRPEVAIGAIAAVAGRIEIVENAEITARLYELGPADRMIGDAASVAEGELRRRQGRYRGARAPSDIGGRDVVLVDDGMATGASIRAAIAVIGAERPARVTVAVPVAFAGTCARVRPLVDDVVCPWEPSDLWSVGEAYDDFSQTSDDEVRRILAGSHAR
ncbi:phosphoribosyltransferase [Labedella phragmitis]|uniref:Phosphoribosyltransferase n=1 Tax=Labedella phragmitis TaxID=2498849 RepID=A0A3S3ZAT3_9MICO|nr:phosphoribosyltransferase family protein [Labedella phragmitis]RWZ51450.1 phosphoribosyltransferase [Labedella phragmitis]